MTRELHYTHPSKGPCTTDLSLWIKTMCDPSIRACEHESSRNLATQATSVEWRASAATYWTTDPYTVVQLPTDTNDAWNFWSNIHDTDGKKWLTKCRLSSLHTIAKRYTSLPSVSPMLVHPLIKPLCLQEKRCYWIGPYISNWYNLLYDEQMHVRSKRLENYYLLCTKPKSYGRHTSKIMHCGAWVRSDTRLLYW